MLGVRERNYGVDLLKVVAMFMICILHTVGHGGILDGNDLSLKGHAVYLLHLSCFCAVNLYAITSGYLCLESKNRSSNIINLWIQVAFYSVLITVFGIIFSWVEDNTAWVIVDSFFPVLNNTYWYFTAYFCLFFFMPLINYAVLYAPRRAVECSICAVVLLFGFANSIGEKSVFSLSNGYSVIWIGCMYLVGAYLKKYDPLKNFNWWKSLVAFIICVILAFLSKRLIESYAVNERYQLSKHAFLFYPSPFIFFEALFLFNLFQHLRLKGGFSKVVSVLSPLTFGVFLIHDNPIIRNKFISEKFAHYVDYPIAKMLFMIFLTALVIFLICILIDFIRSQLFKLIKVKSFSRWLSDKISKLTDFVFNRKDKKEEQVVFLNDNEKEKEEYEKSSGNIE